MRIALDLIKPCVGKRISDVGCGSGKFVVECARRGAKVCGIDVSCNMIKIARASCKKNNIQAELIVGDALKVLPEGFDFSVALGVFEYFDDPAPILGNMLASVEEGGKVIFSVPSLFAFQTPIRKVQLYFRGVKCYFYTPKRLKKLKDRFKQAMDMEIYIYGPGYVVQLTKNPNAPHCMITVYRGPRVMPLRSFLGRGQYPIVKFSNSAAFERRIANEACIK